MNINSNIGQQVEALNDIIRILTAQREQANNAAMQAEARFMALQRHVERAALEHKSAVDELQSTINELRDAHDAKPKAEPKSEENV